MDELELKSIIEEKLKNSINESSTLESDQTDALSIYNGDAYGNEIQGRSAFVTREVMEQIEWAMPSLMKVFASGNRFVQFEPMGADDERQAEHETDAVNYVFRKAGGWQIFHDWFKTALIHKVGYVKAYYDDEVEVITEQVTVSEFDLPLFTENKEIEIVAHDEVEQDGLILHEIEIRTKKTSKKLCVEVIPNEEMRVSKNCKSIELDKADFVAHEREMTVSECIEMGWPKDIIEESVGTEDDDLYRSEYEDTPSDEIDLSMRPVRVAECYMQVDFDGDKTAEYRRVVKIGNHIVENDPWGECPFEAITPIPMPHQHIGNSLVDMVEDIQRAKSDLFRSIIDNLRLTNNPEKEVVWNNIISPDELLVSFPGGNKRVKQIGSINPLTVPFTAGSSIPILAMLDQMKEARTGISRHTMGLDADALAQSTKGAFMGAMNQANQRIEMIARNFAETGVKGLFRKIHALIVDNVKDSFSMQMNNEWQDANPSQWRKRKDLIVNVGLGNGNKDEQIGRLVQLAEKQAQLMQSGSPLVSQKNLYNTLSRIIEAADLKEPSLFFTDPDTVDQQPQGPSAEEQMMQLQKDMLEDQKQYQQARNQLEIEKLKASIAKDKRAFVKDQQDVAIRLGDQKIKAADVELKHSYDIPNLGVQL